ncbi:D-methionine transport system ATP-binding protein [Marinobacter sp. LV10R510-11A]|uniref:methionine ABC transporter ATP-binding protein n=1 Tax=Marinobacter sp. LV10R510-11A TaxID=1415568 RepID=UPI000BB8AAFD|nr:methionine ABC transporter ATP-binding protein [Marinobacter sp. LV10R510-11A]SOB77141.1 D-methionine transport system ATP-binding protein [Marinobacter sp. LV10R510-11A]
MIVFNQVQKSYQVGGRAIPALHPTDMTIETGEVFGIVGHSGAGKSTLVRLINLLEPATDGDILVDNENITQYSAAELRAFRRKVGMIFQHFNLLSSKTAADNIAFPMKLAGIYSKAEIRDRVQELLARVSLMDQADKYPSQLSGGQKQRVGIARALACRPTILLCDEATSALDPQTTQSVLRLLAEINKELGLTIVLITHEMDVVRRVCDRVAVMDGGRVVEMGLVSDVFLHPQHPTTREFVFESENVDSQSRQEDLQKAKGRILRLTFKGESTYQPLLGSVARASGVDFSILSGRIDHIKDTPYGQLTLSLVGGDLAVAMGALEAADVHVEVLR